MNLMRETKIETIEFRTDIPLNEAFNIAFSEVPGEFRDSVVLMREALCYERQETDAECDRRLMFEKFAMQKQETEKLQKESTWLGSQLKAPLHAIIDSLNQEWTQIKTGKGVEMSASVPMYDGRFASVKVKIEVMDNDV